MDLWHYGVTALKYMSLLNKIPIKIFGYLHAGSWDLYDRITQSGFRQNHFKQVEESWLLQSDGIFVATQFHKDIICNYSTQSTIYLLRGILS